MVVAHGLIQRFPGKRAQPIQLSDEGKADELINNVTEDEIKLVEKYNDLSLEEIIQGSENSKVTSSGIKDLFKNCLVCCVVLCLVC